jgi:hypothetical protein
VLLAFSLLALLDFSALDELAAFDGLVALELATLELATPLLAMSAVLDFILELELDFVGKEGMDADEPPSSSPLLPF